MRIFRARPEIISVHVPKTAGSSFHSVLKEVYGFRLKHIQSEKDRTLWNNGKKYRSNKPGVKAVHGHITAHPAWLQQYPDAHLVAWVRDPVERAISAYFHWRKNVDHQDEKHRHFAKRDPDLVEFVSLPDFSQTTNALKTYLGNVPADRFFFIGETEHFTRDVKFLAQAMRWEMPHIPNENVNAAKPDVDNSTKEKLKELLSDEYARYEELLRKAGAGRQ